VPSCVTLTDGSPSWDPVPRDIGQRGCHGLGPDVAYGTIRWWAALICATLVLVIWQGHDAREIASHDPMTGLLSGSGFDARLEEILVGVRRSAGRAALLAIDLNDFKDVATALLSGHSALSNNAGSRG